MNNLLTEGAAVSLHFVVRKQFPRVPPLDPEARYEWEMAKNERTESDVPYLLRQFDRLFTVYGFLAALALAVVIADGWGAATFPATALLIAMVGKMAEAGRAHRMLREHRAGGFGWFLASPSRWIPPSTTRSNSLLLTYDPIFSFDLKGDSTNA